MRPIEILLLIVAFLAGSFGFIMILGGSMNLPEAENLKSDLGFILGLGIVPLAAGLALAFHVFRRRGHRRRESLERSILNMAEKNGGHLSPPEVARQTNLTLDEAKDLLEHLHLSGHCQTHLAETGQLDYVFPRLERQTTTQEATS